ncbi:MAG TPA: LytTR family transcriptional regulator DNA-binding domain-containing protein [Flavilitoribacter sp.]|nr:LytTR family transcriptional regulator DNA-binding domain-containing protein [Flavilitoribacter sp.]HMQ86866.1 LytTR family transcriptional regulator DNA-binding domain-containing protein [Flavilitoribacter sp.]
MVKTMIISADAAVLSAIENSLDRYGLMANAVTCFGTDGILARLSTDEPDLVFVDINLFNLDQQIFIAAFETCLFELILVDPGNGREGLKFRHFKSFPGFSSELPMVLAGAVKCIKEYSAFRDLVFFPKNDRVVQSSNRIAFSVGNHLEFISVSNVIYGQAEGNFTRLYLEGDQALFVSHALKELEVRLTPFGFCRIHNRFIANLHKILRYHKGDGGEVELASGMKLPVARSRKAGFLNQVAN